MKTVQVTFELADADTITGLVEWMDAHCPYVWKTSSLHPQSITEVRNHMERREIIGMATTVLGAYDPPAAELRYREWVKATNEENRQRVEEALLENLSEHVSDNEFFVWRMEFEKGRPE